MLTLKRWLCFAALAAASLALAQAPRPSVMPFPLEFKRTPSGFSKEDKEAMQRDYTRLLRLAGGQVPDFARYDLALKELKRQDCEREDECLVQLAKKSEALYALYASVDSTLEGAVLVTGRVVRDDGKVACASQSVKLARGKDPFKDIARNALTQLFSQLKVGELEAVRKVEVAKAEPVKVEPVKVVPPVVTDPPPAMPPLVTEDSGAGARAAGQGLVFGGAGIAVVGAVLAAVGGLNGSALGLQNEPVPFAKLDALTSARTLTTVGFVGLGVGAVSAAVGAILWGTAGAAPVTQVSVVPTVGGGVVQLGGRF